MQTVMTLLFAIGALLYRSTINQAETMRWVAHTHEVLARIHSDYERAYYCGIIWERLAHAQLRHSRPGGAAAAYHSLREAMSHYEQAEAIRPPGVAG